MENLATRFAIGSRMPGPLLSPSLLLEECGLARTARVNILLVNVSADVQRIVESLLIDRQGVAPIWRPGKPLTLRQVARPRTMILHEVGALKADEQRRLLAWLEGKGRMTQIISTSPTPLLAAVDAGTFLDTLYYRLNVVYVDVADGRLGSQPS
jgi:transcriptional regulator of acetoin/glycerol metabolism